MIIWQTVVYLLVSKHCFLIMDCFLSLRHVFFPPLERWAKPIKTAELLGGGAVVYNDSRHVAL